MDFGSAPALYYLGVMRFVWALLLLALAACDSRDPAPPFGPRDGSTSPPLAALTLELVEPESPLRLAADEIADLRLRVVRTTSGEPEQGVNVTCGAFGVLGGTSLGSSSPSDASGEVHVELRAGVEPAFLRLVCSASRASALVVHAAVSPSGAFGALVVEPTYTGARAFSDVRVDVHYGRTCPPPRGITPEQEVRGSSGETLRVEPVPVELAPIVVVSLLDSGGRPVARGCAGPVEALEGEDLVVEVSPVDLPLAVARDYPAALRVRTADAIPLASAAGRVAAQATVGAFGDEVDTMLAWLRAALIQRGFEVDLLTFDLEITGQFEIDLEAEYALAGRSPSRGIDALDDALATRAGALSLEGTLSVDEADAGYALLFDVDALSAGATFGALRPVTSFGGSTSGMGSAGALVENAFEGELRFGFGGGAIVAAGLEAGADTSTRAAWLDAFGCDVFANLPSFEVSFLECDDRCRFEVCEEVFDRVLAAYLDGVRGVSAGSALSVSMRARFGDDGVGVEPSSVVVEDVVGRLLDGASTFELVEAELTLSL